MDNSNLRRPDGFSRQVISGATSPRSLLLLGCWLMSSTLLFLPSPSQAFLLIPHQRHNQRFARAAAGDGSGLWGEPDQKSMEELWVVGLGLYGDEEAAFLSNSPEVRVGETISALAVPLVKLGAVDLMKAALESRRGSPMPKAPLLWSSQSLVNRDDGLFDNLPWEWVGEDGKRDGYDTMSFGKGLENEVYFASPYHLMLHLVDTRMGGAVKNLTIVEDYSQTGPGFTLGPVAFITQGQSPSAREVIVDCLLDEVAGLALALQLPVHIPTRLFRNRAVQATLSLSRGKGGKAVLWAEPDRRDWDEDKVPELWMGRYTNVRPAWKIDEAEEVLGMTAQAMRLCLLASRAQRIPRRRESREKFEEALIPLLDEAVRAEVRIAKAVQAGDLALAQRLRENLSERGKLRQVIREAKKEGDMSKAAYFQEILDGLTRARHDVSQDDGEYSRDLDADDWYIKNRRI